MDDIIVDKTKYNDNYIKYLYELALLNKIKDKELITEEESIKIENYIISKYNIQD